MRCCLASIAEYIGDEKIGTTIGCKYHKDKEEPVARIATDGVWEWIGIHASGEPGKGEG